MQQPQQPPNPRNAMPPELQALLQQEMVKKTQQQNAVLPMAVLQWKLQGLLTSCFVGSAFDRVRILLQTQGHAYHNGNNAIQSIQVRILACKIRMCASSLVVPL